MNAITEKQKETIERLARIAKVQVGNVEGMSCQEASEAITALIERINSSRRKKEGRNAGRDYSSDALAGLAVKILAQRCKVEDIVGKEERFRKRAVELYQVFSSARQACLAA